MTSDEYQNLVDEIHSVTERGSLYLQHLCLSVAGELKNEKVSKPDLDPCDENTIDFDWEDSETAFNLRVFCGHMTPVVGWSFNPDWKTFANGKGPDMGIVNGLFRWRMTFKETSCYPYLEFYRDKDE